MKIKVIEILGESRLDKYLSDTTELSRSQVQKLIKLDKILINGELAKSKTKIELDDVIELDYIDNNDSSNIVAQEMELDIIYEDEDLLIVNKPSGLVVHPAPGHYTDTLVNGLLFYSKSLSNINGDFRPGIVHRIDKDTSGLLLIAKNNKSHEILSLQLQDKTLFRQYLAIVHGEIEEEEGEIIAPIGRDPKNRKKMAITPRNSKYAKTDFKVIERLENYTVVECRLETGRTHQIRVHFHFINYPVVGDITYGPKKTIDTLGQALHAYKLGFIHPTTGEYMEFEATPPEEFNKTLELIRG